VPPPSKNKKGEKKAKDTKAPGPVRLRKRKRIVVHGSSDIEAEVGREGDTDEEVDEEIVYRPRGTRSRPTQT
jgi:hypothetical protein